MPFKVGDKVKWLDEDRIGIVRYSAYSYAIELDPSFMGHHCSGHVSSPHGWWISEDRLILVEPAVIKTKQELIIDKIKYLDNKFTQRNKNHGYQTSTI